MSAAIDDGLDVIIVHSQCERGGDSRPSCAVWLGNSGFGGHLNFLFDGSIYIDIRLGIEVGRSARLRNYIMIEVID